MFLQPIKNLINAQCCTGIGTTLLLIHLGFMGGWTSPTLIRLMNEDSHIHLTTEQSSWVASLLNLSRLLGCVLGPVSTHYLGSKRSIFITLIPVALGWVLIVFANSPEWLYASRLFSGLALGMTFSIFPLYVSEVALTEIRGALISLATVGVPFGQLISTTCGTYLPVDVASGIYLVLALALMVLFYWLPESPHHLLKIGQRDKAKESIDWYRGSKNVDEELESINNLLICNSSEKFKDKVRELLVPPMRKCTMHITILFASTQLSGLNIMLFYMEPILVQAKFTLISPATLVIYINFCSTIAAVISIFLIDRFGRKMLLLISGVGISISMIAMTCHFFLLNANIVDIETLQFIPVSSMLLFMLAFFFGTFPVPNAILGEIFPSNLKCTAACLAILLSTIVSFISVKSYQPLIDCIGQAYVFLIYTIFTLATIPYIVFAIPETKGKSLQQIQDEIKNS